MMTQDEHDVAYTEGYRLALRQHIMLGLAHLGYEGAEKKALQWVVEREQAIGQLRALCKEFGDNDWDEQLHLGDIIEKHLGKHLHGVAAGDGNMIVKDVDVIALEHIRWLRVQSSPHNDKIADCMEAMLALAQKGPR